ncbi:hypothetical protein L0U85_10405 [Glycomyces sp. L485]|uniref:hypothetical protein n=1 Tax=Glycomyces sp. L485 TaxID=2909235 RepID=UPI001F4B7A71|nr:hypothetical protein [Glycomyces sp. L485]MCH7231260.1 hypothetical protein [Glycomyces sp. L485]
MSSVSGGAYDGPPANVPPPKGWRVESVAVTGEPRRMPKQDHAAIDAAEQRAKLVTHWTALTAVVLMFAVVIIGMVRG